MVIIGENQKKDPKSKVNPTHTRQSGLAEYMSLFLYRNIVGGCLW